MASWYKTKTITGALMGKFYKMKKIADAVEQKKTANLATLKMFCNNTLNKFNEVISMDNLDDIPGDELPLKLCGGQYVAHPHRLLGSSDIKHFCNVCGDEKWFKKAYPLIEIEETEQNMDF